MSANLSNYPTGSDTADAPWNEPQSSRHSVSCNGCGLCVDRYAESTIEVFISRKAAEFFCSNACRSRRVWEQTPDAMGRTELLALVAALNAIVICEPGRISALAQYDCHEASYQNENGEWICPNIDDLKQYAAALLEQFAPTGVEVAWTFPALDAGDDLREAMKKVVTTTEVSQ